MGFVGGEVFKRTMSASNIYKVNRCLSRRKMCQFILSHAVAANVPLLCVGGFWNNQLSTENKLYLKILNFLYHVHPLTLKQVLAPATLFRYSKRPLTTAASPMNTGYALHFACPRIGEGIVAGANKKHGHPIQTRSDCPQINTCPPTKKALVESRQATVKKSNVNKCRK